MARTTTLGAPTAAAVARLDRCLHRRPRRRHRRRRARALRVGRGRGRRGGVAPPAGRPCSRQPRSNGGEGSGVAPPPTRRAACRAAVAPRAPLCPRRAAPGRRSVAAAAAARDWQRPRARGPGRRGGRAAPCHAIEPHGMRRSRHATRAAAVRCRGRPRPVRCGVQAGCRRGAGRVRGGRCGRGRTCCR